VLGGKRLLGDCTKAVFSARGVYFFFEPGEMRTTSGEGLRVVRIGTHAVSEGSRSTLWGRLCQHRGNAGSEGGNHRGSIFRLLVGGALMQRDPELWCPTWACGNSAKGDVRTGELDLEARVSRYLRAMPFLWLEIDDEPSKASLRGYIERNCIALLSNIGARSTETIDPPSLDWLGRRSPREVIRVSGLWNQNHVAEAYDSHFLDVLGDLVR